MAFIPAPGTAEIVFKGTWAALFPLRQVFHVDKSNDGLGTPWTLQQLEDATQRFSLAYQAFLPKIPNEANFTEVTGRDLSVEDGLVSSFPTGLQGASTGKSVGGYAGPVVQWKVGSAGRHNGRTFLPGFPAIEIDELGLLDETARLAVKSYAQSFLNDLKAATDGIHPGPPLDLVVLSTAGSGVPLQRTSRVVIGSDVRKEVGIQRRRRPS